MTVTVPGLTTVEVGSWVIEYQVRPLAPLVESDPRAMNVAATSPEKIGPISEGEGCG